MILINVISDKDGLIALSPSGAIEGEYQAGCADADWFTKKFPTLANAKVPLNDADYGTLVAIDHYWRLNAEKWRAEGLI